MRAQVSDEQGVQWMIRYDDDAIPPRHPGAWSLMHDIPRPPHGVRDELVIVDPTGAVLALVPEVHTWTIDEDNTLTVAPSVVSHSGWHGFIHASGMA